MLGKRKAAEKTCPEGAAESSGMKKSDGKPAALRNVADVVGKSEDSLFGSNIFSHATLSQVHSELQQTSDGLSVATIFKGKGSLKQKNTSEDASEDCVVVPQGSTEAPKKGQYSEETLKVLSKWEALQKEIAAEEPLDTDSSDDAVVCCEEEPIEKNIFRVLGPGRLLRFDLDPEQRLAGPLEDIAKAYGVPANRVVVCDDDGNAVEPWDKPQNLKPGTIYQCIVRRSWGESSEPAPSEPEKSTSESAPPEPEKSMIAVKFQCSSKRKPALLKIAEDEPLQEGARKFAEIAGLDPSNLVIHFDGDRLDPCKTAKELGIEDGDCVDVSVAKH